MRKPLYSKLKRADPRHIQKYHEWMDSPAYRDLKPVARCLIDEFLLICFPWDRNGKLSISVKQAAKLLKCDEKTAGKAFHALVEHGFLKLRRGQIWQERVAREWQLTILPSDRRNEPSDDWRHWRPAGSSDEEISICRPEKSRQSGGNIGAALRGISGR